MSECDISGLSLRIALRYRLVIMYDTMPNPREWQVHYIMDEMLLNGCIVDTNKANILEPVQLLETIEKS